MHPLNTEESQRLQRDIKVLVWVMTQPNNHKTKAVSVRDTWGKRVDKLIFMSSQEDASSPSVQLNATEGRNLLWGKTKEAFKHIHQHYVDDYDWFMKADDDTFVVVENLRYLLSLYDPEIPIFFGCKFKKFNGQIFMSGGAGYVLSRTAVKKFVEEALPDPKKCRATDDTSAEDVEIAEMGPNCCSDTAIAFHYIAPDKMWELEYLLYQLRPHGVITQQPFPTALPLLYQLRAIPQQPFPTALPPDLKSVPEQMMHSSTTRSSVSSAGEIHATSSGADAQ
ncbi:glycoprotein-N-acetylgalactosamine 3-beta-galactosyltransferase 1 [Hyalella azteca]|uniref:Glycoprotein-N-acetylgalactosamine 3-beta-galactosyltransferase 1 n=1 Tax=Hyalella azteca TaxID=294128 RepID=A0A979FKB9_HYAAZ|nr:glycoprotein-N-acetylgalactosamine 3-beta-galactosyltransferase 1 [Hyalella azteca]